MSNGTRTRDILDHNQVLYQLSYTHHDRLCTGREKVYTFRRGGRARLSAGAPRPGNSRGRPQPAGSRCFAAMALAVGESGPGEGTKTASR